MNIVSTVEARAQASHLMQPANRALNNPARFPQAASVLGVSTRQNRLNTALTQLFTMRFRVVGAVALNTVGTPARPARLAGNGGNGFHQGKQLRDVVRVSAGQRGREGYAVGVGDHMMFAAGFAAICGIGARFFPPCTARTDDESTIARDQSIWSACCKCASKASWMRCHTPRFCQACKRRQAVMPLPQPSSCGKCSQGNPVFKMKRIADSALRWSIGLRPGKRLRRFFGGGSNGSMIAHNLSSKIGCAMITPPCVTPNVA